MLKAKNHGTGQSVYSLRKSRQDFYLKYADDGKSKDVGPDMIMLKDDIAEEDDRIDSPFPAAFSPTENKPGYSLDIDLHLDAPEDAEGQKDTKSGMAELYAQVVPKSERTKNADSDKKDFETSDDTPVSNGEVTVSVDPHSNYAKVVPKAQRTKETTIPNGKADSNGDILKAQARSKVLSAIGSQPMAVQNGNNGISYRQNVPTSKRIDSALGGKITYNESAEL